MIDEANHKVLVTAFIWGLRPGEILFFLYKNDPKTMVETLYKATKNMNVEDAMIAQGDGPRNRERQDDPHTNRGWKIAPTNDRKDVKRSRP